MSFSIALSSDATMFSSRTPSSIFLEILLIKSDSLTTLPAPNMSSNTILKASVTDALPPM